MKPFIFILFSFVCSLSYAQLPTTNISISQVKSTLGASTYELSDLASHQNINKWSSHKPVDYPSNYNAGNYGLNINASTMGSFYLGDWEYRDRIEYSLGQFRSYNHSASPPVSNEQYQSADTYDAASFFAPTFSTTSDIQIEEILDQYGGAWDAANPLYFGVRLDLNGNTYYSVESTDIRTYPSTGVHFDFSDSKFYSFGTGTVSYRTFVTTEYYSSLDLFTGTELAANPNDQDNLIFELPNGRGTFEKITQPSNIEPAFYAGTVPIDFGITGTVTRGDGFLYYTVTNNSGSATNVTPTLHVTDLSGNILTPDKVGLTVSAPIGTSTPFIFAFDRGWTADYNQKYIVSLSL